jgi:cardiolipin synthase
MPNDGCTPTEDTKMSLIKDWKKEIFTIPNLLSLFRILLIPVYIILYLNAKEPHEHFLAAAILAVSCLTDLIDGKIARHFNMISTVGKVLDPFADKLTQLTLTICLTVRYPAMWFVLVLFLTKEFFQLFAAIFNLRRGKVLPGALLAGKICTTVLFVSMFFMVLIPAMDPVVVHLLALVDSAALLTAFICYIFAFFGKHAKVEDVE